MSFSFNLFQDAALTRPLTGALTFYGDLTNPAPVDKQLWFGSPASGSKCQASSNPGVDQIALSIADAAPSSGEPASSIKLALSQSALAAATGGASLNLGATINSGSANAVPVWMRFTDATGALGTYTDLSWTFNNLIESAQ